MSQNEVERFLGRIITDADFRAHTERSLERACYSEGYALSTVELSFLGNLDFQLFQQLSETIDDSIKRSSMNCSGLEKQDPKA
ncbi:MAG: Os1348 family NHLP clan protein [Desulfobulbus sp.]